MAALQRRLDGLAVVALVALADGLLLVPLPLEARLAGALLLFVALPGYLFTQAVFRGPRPCGLERWLLALGCGYVLAILLALALHILVRPLATPHVLLGATALNGGLLLVALARRARLRPRLGRPGWPVLAVLALAAPFRLANLGYSEFQGDEAKVVLRAMALLQGVPDALIAHRKPPGEVLLQATFAGGLGAITELVGRLPFALAGVAAVVAIYQLGTALFGTRAGLVAALLLAINGYFVAFGRILQYESLILFLAILAVLCLVRFAEGSNDRRGYAVVGALLLGGAGLTAFSAVFLLPVAALALWPSVFGPKRATRRELLVWLWPLALLVPSAIVVYGVLPRTSGDALGLDTFEPYLSARLGDRPPYFNLGRFLLSVNHYTSGLYLVVVLGAGVLTLVAGALRLRNPSVRCSPGWKLALLWLAVPLLTHLFLVRVPWAHWREVFPGAVLLAGVAAAGLYARLAYRPARLAALLAGGLFLAASGHYVYVAWIQPWPEYQLTYPQYRHPLDWSNARTPQGGSNLGATLHHGWKAVAALMAQGAFPADYAGAERPEAAWYLKRVRLCPDGASSYIRSPSSAGDRRAIQQGERMEGFFLAGRVYVGDRPKLALHTRKRPAGGPQAFRAEDYGAWFDRELSSPWVPIGPLYRPFATGAPDCPRTG
jgi:hypothetical protein